MNDSQDMEERYIASIDLGTSKISVGVAKVQGSNVQVVYYKENASQGIRYSYVYNPKMVEDRLRAALSEAQQELRIKIKQVIVGLPRYYVRQETGSASIERENGDSQIEESEVRALKSEALGSYPLEDKNEVIYGAVAQSFSTEEEFNELENDIIGMTASKLEGNFKVFIGNRRHSINIDNVFRGMDISIARKYFTPGITAKAVLKDEQMENGVALMDIGAGVSSVTIFKGKIMRFYAAIPFGGNSITNDIKSECNISFSLAENIKKAYGACIPNKLSSFGEKILQINDENDEPVKKIPVKYLSEIITARMREIVEALLYEIERSNYAREDQLRAGVVVTGGCAELVNCANLVKEMSGYSVRIGSPRPFFSCDGCEEARTAGAATTMGMILSAKGDKSLNCAGISSSWASPAREPRTAIVREPVTEEIPAEEAVLETAAETSTGSVDSETSAHGSTDLGTSAPRTSVDGAASSDAGYHERGRDRTEESHATGMSDRGTSEAGATEAGSFESKSPIERSVLDGQFSEDGDYSSGFKPYGKDEARSWESDRGESGRKSREEKKEGPGLFKWVKHKLNKIYDEMGKEEV